MSPVVGGVFSENCVTGTLDTYVNDFTETAFSGDVENGQSIKAYTCRLQGSTTWFKGDFSNLFAGKYVSFQHYDRGLYHRVSGVFNVAYNISLPYLKLTSSNCSDLVCQSNGFRKAPDGGQSDAEPESYDADLNRPLYPLGFSDATAIPNNIHGRFSNVQAVAFNIYGLAVSKPLYLALQADQGLAATVRPTVPKAVIASMLSNSFDPSISWKALLPNSPLVNVQQINICRGQNGLGMQTAANAFFMEYPRNALGLMPATNTANSEFENDIAHIGNAGSIMVYEAPSAVHVSRCLDKANDTNSFAIGNLSLETHETLKWSFAAIDGAVASRDNAKKGHYQYVFESTMQINNAAGATQKMFLYDMIDASKKSSYLNMLAASAQNGVMALPTAPGCAAGDFGRYQVGSTNEKYCSRVTRYGDGNQLLSIDR